MQYINKTLLKECETCKEHFLTEGHLKKHMDKYHTLKNTKIDEIVILPEVTERRKNNLHEIFIDTVSLKDAFGQKNALHQKTQLGVPGIAADDPWKS